MSKSAAPRCRGDAAAGHYMFVNCQPARRLCLPDLAPAQAIVRAGERRGDAELLPSRAVGLAVLSRLCFDSRSVFAFLSRRLSSVHVRRCVSVAALPSRVWLCVPVAALRPRARLVSRSCRGAYPRFTPAVCLATNRTACDTLRSYSAGSRSPFARSRCVGAVI